MKRYFKFLLLLLWIYVSIILSTWLYMNLNLLFLWVIPILVILRPKRLITRNTMYIPIAIIALVVISGRFPNIFGPILGTISFLLVLGIARVIPKKAFVLTAVLYVIAFGVSVYACLFHYPFMLHVYMDLGISRETSYYAWTAQGVPLPQKTVYISSSTITGAKYISNTKKDGLISFYSRISDSDTFECQSEEDKVILLFTYKHKQFKVEVIEVDYWRRGAFNIDYIK